MSAEFHVKVTLYLCLQEETAFGGETSASTQEYKLAKLQNLW